jgi:hypothetical protein
MLMLGVPMESEGGAAAAVPFPPFIAIMAPAAPPATSAAITHFVLLLCEPFSGDAPVCVIETDGRSVSALVLGNVGWAGVPGAGVLAPLLDIGTVSAGGGGGEGNWASISTEAVTSSAGDMRTARSAVSAIER